MKKILYLLLITVILINCKTEEVDLYDSPNYISFTNAQQDTIIISFFLLGNLSEYNLPIEVRYTGIPVNHPLEFSIVTVDTSTTMPADKMVLPQPTFQPMSKLDTLYVKLTNFPELQTATKSLCLELKENTNFLLGDRNHRRIYFLINDNVAKPDWWTFRVENYFLGTYSDAKFRKLMEVVRPDLSKISESWIRTWALEFKIYLAEMAAAGTPVTEVDGSLMTVPARM